MCGEAIDAAAIAGAGAAVGRLVRGDAGLSVRATRAGNRIGEPVVRGLPLTAVRVGVAR